MSRRTQDPARFSFFFCLQGFHLLRLCFPSHSALLPLQLSCSSFNPISLWFGLLPFRSPLLGKSLLFSSPPGTWMFRFPGSLSLFIKRDGILLAGYRVSPFGHRRVFASLQLGAAFRSSVRPSSVSSGQASSVRPCLLDQLFLFLSMLFRDSFLP